MANPGVLLIVSTLETLGISADALKIAQASIPIAVAAFILFLIQNYMLDRSLKQKYSSNNNSKGE